TRVKSDLSVCLCLARSITDKPACYYELTKRVYSRNCVVCRKFNEPLDPVVEKKIISDEQRSGSCLGYLSKEGWRRSEFDDIETGPPLSADELESVHEDLAVWRSPL